MSSMIRCIDARQRFASARAFQLLHPFRQPVHLGRNRGQRLRQRIVDLLGIGDHDALAFAEE